jgi:hypothetical protein
MLRGVLAASAWLALLAAPALAQKDPHHDAKSLNARLTDLHKANPKITRLVTVTTTDKGDVLALEVDPDGTFAKDAPALLVQGGVHGSEWISTEVALRLAELTVDQAPQLAGLTYRFVPAVNIEGFNSGTRTAPDHDGGERFDPNRDWPVPEQDDHPSKPLIQAMRDYASKGKVVGVLDYHSAAECIMWGYAYSRSKQPPEVEALQVVAERMAKPMGYCIGQVAKVISYKHQGTAADWYQHALKVPTLLIELAGVDDPGSTTAEQILLEQERPYRLFVAWLIERIGKTPVAVATGDDDDCKTVTVSLGAGDLGYKAEGPVCGGLRHGKWKFSYLTGELMREGEYEKGLEQGAWTTYHKDGDKQDDANYVDGTPDGKVVRYASNGKKVMERSYDHGVREGALYRWTDDGKLFMARSCHGGTCSTKCKASGERYCKIGDDGKIALTPAPRKCSGKRGCSESRRRPKPRR